MNSKKTIWFMSGYANLYHAIKDIKQEDKENKYNVLCSHTNKHFVGAESADFFEVEPHKKDENLISFCKEMIIKYNVKVIFPSQKQSFLYKYKKEFEKLGANLVTVGNSNMVDTINQKDLFYKKIEKWNIVNVPQFEVFKTNKEFKQAYKSLIKNNSILCMKPSYGVYGVGFYILTKNKKQIFDTLEQNQKISVKEFLRQSKSVKFKKMLLMQYLNGIERSVDCVAVNGVLIGAVIRKKNIGNLPQSIENNPELINQVEKLVKKLKLNGLFNIQFKDLNNVPYLLEINPRLSGRSFYATIAGVNLTYVASEIFSGEKKAEDFNFNIKYNMAIHAINYPIIVEKNEYTKNEINNYTSISGNLISEKESI